MILERLHEIEHLSEEKLALRLEGRKMLDVGAGQMMLQMAYFSAKNDVHGVDLDVIASGIDVTRVPPDAAHERGQACGKDRRPKEPH